MRDRKVRDCVGDEAPENNLRLGSSTFAALLKAGEASVLRILFGTRGNVGARGVLRIVFGIDDPAAVSGAC